VFENLFFKSPPSENPAYATAENDLKSSHIIGTGKTKVRNKSELILTENWNSEIVLEFVDFQSYRFTVHKIVGFRIRDLEL